MLWVIEFFKVGLTGLKKFGFSGIRISNFTLFDKKYFEKILPTFVGGMFYN